MRLGRSSDQLQAPSIQPLKGLLRTRGCSESIDHWFVFVVGSGILAAHGYPLADSLFEFASALSTVDISVGITFPQAPAGVLWTEMTGMILGRLEFFTVVVGLAKLVSDVPSLLKTDQPGVQG